MCQIERGGIKPGGQVGRLNLGGEDANVAAVDADTSDYNLFFIFIVEQDTFKGVILKNIHIMTDKYNWSSSLLIKLSVILALWCFAI